MLFKQLAPKRPFPRGVTCSAMLPDGDLLLGTGGGCLCRTGLDLNAVLLDFGFGFVFRFGREVQESRQNKTKNTTNNETKNTV